MTIRFRVLTRKGIVARVCLLAAVGVAGLLTWLKIDARSGPGSASGARDQSAAIRALPEVPSVPPAPDTPRPRPARGSLLGQFEVPALNMSWAVLEGTDNATLDRSIGHIEGTAAIGETGNIGIAGHRNTHFRKLEWIRRGDEIVLTSKDGTFHYRVNHVKLYKPTDVDVLDAAHGPAVTLVTCFPFEYVGSAPLRLIVRAVAVEERLTRQVAPGTGPGLTRY